MICDRCHQDAPLSIDGLCEPCDLHEQADLLEHWRTDLLAAAMGEGVAGEDET